MKTFRLLICLVMILFSYATFGQDPKTPADLRRVAQEYYNWRNQNYPVCSSDAGLHTWDQKLTDYSLSAVLMRRLQVKETLAKVRAMPTANWSNEDRIDWLLFAPNSTVQTFSTASSTLKKLIRKPTLTNAVTESSRC